MSKKKNDLRFVNSTRWAEIKDCVEYHTNLASLRKAPTIFRLLNHPGITVGKQQFSVSFNSNNPADSIIDIQNANSIMNKVKPTGCTPLTNHILEIQASIMEMSPDLLKEGKRVAVVIATDGLPTDDRGYHSDIIRDQFVNALRLLEGLPVWLVIRLCTDEDDVVEFYNSLDEQLELSLEVLDDYVGEAQEVYSCNKWLNYALPLHRMREGGFHDKLFDLLDERTFNKGEIREFCELLFGPTDGCPDPEIDWEGFLKVISSILKHEDEQYNPIKKKPTPWIDVNALNKIYGDSSCIIM